MININLFAGSQRRLKVLHLTFHKGCLNPLQSMAEALNLEVESWFIPQLPPYSFDGVSPNNACYNIGHERAKRIWDLHKEKFNTFDLIFTSDTAPLGRIFLQNGWKKPLIIWICNRFDYCDRSHLDCEFPDEEFYELFRRATKQKNVALVANSEIELLYARDNGVNLEPLIIKPFIKVKKEEFKYDIRNLFYLPTYHNENSFMNLSDFCTQMGIENYGGWHNGLEDLKTYKGIIHLPYAWSTIALFENISIGIPYFIPSEQFLEKLMQSSNYWHQEAAYLIHGKKYHVSEWYNKEHRQIINYFDSWEDLKNKIEMHDNIKQRKKILAFAKKHQDTMIQRWREVFAKVQGK